MKTTKCILYQQDAGVLIYFHNIAQAISAVLLNTSTAVTGPQVLTGTHSRAAIHFCLIEYVIWGRVNQRDSFINSSVIDHFGNIRRAGNTFVKGCFSQL